MHNDLLHNLYSSANISRVVKSRQMRQAEYAEHTGQIRNARRIFIGKPKAKRPLMRLWCTQTNNIKINKLCTRQ